MINNSIKNSSQSNTRSYSNIYDIKSFIRYDFMTKYFPMDEINDLNVGLIGFNTDLIGTITEDSYNTITTFIQEMYPNTAYLPETLYTYAALFRMNELMARPATLSIVLLVPEAAILEYGTNNSGFMEIIIDRETIIDVEGISYMPDYDIRIQAKPTKGGKYLFTTMYDYSFENSLNNSTESPYIKNIIYNTDQGKYVGIFCNVHQVLRQDFEDIIINNSIINYPKFSIDYEDQLGNFEVFYKEPTSDEFIQLKKVLKNSPPLTEPFCYYTFKDEDTIEISFSSKTRYFQPKFNSDIRVEMYSTLGAEGNFPLYKGNASNVSVLTSGKRFDYNTKLILHAIPQSDSSGGLSQPDFETIKRIVSEKFATVNSITTETDLQLSFANTKYKTGIDVLFIKKRDDAFERLFSAFSVYKDSDDEIYHLNTLDMKLTNDMFDTVDPSRTIIQPGGIFKYTGSTGYTIERMSGIDLEDDLDEIDEQFLFVNPLMIYVHKNPNIIGFYLNAIDDKVVTNYSFINTDTSNQFISNNLKVSRNSLIGENSYRFEVTISPTSDLSIPLFDEMGNWMEDVKLKLFINNKNGKKFDSFLDFTFVKSDEGVNTYTFETYMTTDDMLSIEEQIRCQVRDYSSGEMKWGLVDYSDLIVDVAVFIKEDNPVKHEFSHIDDLALYTLTNKYSTKDNKLNLVIPFDCIKATVDYEELEGELINNILNVPMVSARDIKMGNKYTDLLRNLNVQYKYIEETMSVIENNYNIDLKFIGTYGRSKNFQTETGELLDSINCSVTFDVKLLDGVSEELTVPRIKEKIIEFFEKINISGDNSIKASNIIQELENEFYEIDYLKFVSFNDYPSSVQVLINTVPDPVMLNNEKLLFFVPEYVTLRPENVRINVLQY